MVKRTGPTNPILKSLVDSLSRKTSERNPFWEDVAKKLAKPTRSRVQVNVAEINRDSKEGQFIVVPGVVMSSGDVNKKLNVAAWRFTAAAEKKIAAAGGKTMTIAELKKEKPKGTDVKIVV